ncbi:efflux RND transporter periplasmic adaptor subunit [Rhodopila sp.]|uniref:efflux RND transporter periplasmic adaptor subunit n=1 Tax=Rhodopila sp. TaxID=2480087 RepID=UPI003D0A8282
MMPRRGALALLAGLIALPALLAGFIARSAWADDPPSVAVQTEKPREGTVPDLLVAYGSARPALDGGMTLSFQQDGRVLAIAVTPGEAVHQGDKLLEFGASATAISTYQQAVHSLAAARQQRNQAAQLLKQQLATRDQLAQADKAVADAQAALDALRREGADLASRTLTAPFDGIVATIPVAPGDRVPAGATLMTITRLDGLVVTVGINPGARSRVRPGQPVHLTPMSDGAPVDGRIVRLDGTLNPRTRMLDADVAVAPGSVIAGTAYRADITVGQFNGWIVPHDALLTDAKGEYLFQVDGSSASRVDVKLVGTAGNNDVVQGTLDPRRPLVVQGNYQLSNKMAVRVSGPGANGPSVSGGGASGAQ